MAAAESTLQRLWCPQNHGQGPHFRDPVPAASAPSSEAWVPGQWGPPPELQACDTTPFPRLLAGGVLPVVYPFFKFYGGVLDLQGYDNCCCTIKWVSYADTEPFFVRSFPMQVITEY